MVKEAPPRLAGRPYRPVDTLHGEDEYLRSAKDMQMSCATTGKDGSCMSLPPISLLLCQLHNLGLPYLIPRLLNMV